MAFHARGRSCPGPCSSWLGLPVLQLVVVPLEVVLVILEVIQAVFLVEREPPSLEARRACVSVVEQLAPLATTTSLGVPEVGSSTQTVRLDLGDLHHATTVSMRKVLATQAQAFRDVYPQAGCIDVLASKPTGFRFYLHAGL